MCVWGGAWSAYVLPRDKTCSTFSATKTTKLPTGPARITVEEKPSVVLRYTLPPCNPSNKGLLVAVASHGPTQHSTDRGAGSRTPVFSSVVLSMYPPPRSCGRHLPSLVHSKAKQWSDLTDPRKRASYSGLVLGTLLASRYQTFQCLCVKLCVYWRLPSRAQFGAEFGNYILADLSKQKSQDYGL